ncbi:hypothetical protein [Acidocella sp. MX-AZ02]|uniref:hypothetical protein n=1 Tax=Acidocella sp. MX-AZ02 TaxID=1214225 RepID=UPI001969FFA9|nr:hypothetical protein [Acidocella sp. MX-AZ02]
MILDHYGQLASKRKLLARDAGVSDRTAENWLLGKNDPQISCIMSIAKNNPAFRADFIAWLEERT